jgi:hypothetical protein
LLPRCGGDAPVDESRGPASAAARLDAARCNKMSNQRDKRDNRTQQDMR